MSAEYRKDAPQHDQPKHQDGALHARKGYETLDAQAGATYRAGAYILGAMFLAAALLVPMYGLLARRESRLQSPAATVIREQPAAAGSFPRLVTSEPLVLKTFREQEDAILNSYGWVEKDRGVARMPVTEAIRIVGERRALPSFPAAPLAATPGPETTPQAPAGISERGPASGASGAAAARPAGGAR